MHHNMHNLCCVYCFWFLAYFFSLAFALLLFLLIFISCSVFECVQKIQKPIKIEKSSKSLITCFVYFTCKFGLVPLYLWRNAFTSLASSYMHICLYGRNLEFYV